MQQPMVAVSEATFGDSDENSRRLSTIGEEFSEDISSVATDDADDRINAGYHINMSNTYNANRGYNANNATTTQQISEYNYAPAGEYAYSSPGQYNLSYGSPAQNSGDGSHDGNDSGADQMVVVNPDNSHAYVEKKGQSGKYSDASDSITKSVSTESAGDASVDDDLSSSGRSSGSGGGNSGNRGSGR
jgi:hypothetical protein